MVKFRGIHISVISQIDARPLPEYSTAHAFDASGCAVACYLPIYLGSQIWFEYSVEGPHPQNAMYLFKLFMDGRLVTSWDCTEKHEYHGKAAYSLHIVKAGKYGERDIVQQSFKFSTVDGRRSPSMKQDCIEIRVHQIQHRHRLRDLPLNTPVLNHLSGSYAFKLVHGGFIEQGRPARRYQYQLLDPKDEPYATFQFCCRSKEYLERHQILDLGRSQSPTSPAISGSYYFDPDTSPKSQSVGDTLEQVHTGSPLEAALTTTNQADLNASITTAQEIVADHPQVYIPHSTSKSSITSKIKDSIEDLPSTVPRSPQLDQSSHKFNLRDSEEAIPSSPTLPHPPHVPYPSSPTRKPRSTIAAPGIQAPLPSPTRLSHQRHQRNKPNLTVTLASATSDHDHKKPRPLSPFTGGGFLRRLVSSPVPATEYGISTKDEVDEQMKDLKLCESVEEGKGGAGDERVGDRTARAQRSGHKLIGFLGRRANRRSAT